MPKKNIVNSKSEISLLLKLAEENGALVEFY